MNSGWTIVTTPRSTDDTTMIPKYDTFELSLGDFKNIYTTSKFKTVPRTEESPLTTQAATWLLIWVEDGERTILHTMHLSNFIPTLETLKLAQLILYRWNIIFRRTAPVWITCVGWIFQLAHGAPVFLVFYIATYSFRAIRPIMSSELGNIRACWPRAWNPAYLWAQRENLRIS